jgi:hypothetical protein
MHNKEMRDELLRLLRLQLKALNSATSSLAGMTSAGWREYAEREARIRVLLENI